MPALKPLTWANKATPPLLCSHQHRAEQLKYKPETQNPQCRQTHQLRQQADN
jgi:hypothetical protein